MEPKSAFLALILLPALGIFSAAQSTPLQDILSEMERADKMIRTLQFAFKQSSRLEGAGDEEEIRGKAFFERPDKFRLERAGADAQTVVCDGKNLWIYNPKAKQVLKDRWENWRGPDSIPRGFLPFVGDLAVIREKYAIELEEKGKGGAVLKLTPKARTPWPAADFRIWLKSKSGIPYRTEMASKTARTTTRISGLKVNPRLSDDLFRFETPAGASEISSSERGTY